MAVKGSFPNGVGTNFQGLGLVLRSAVCEWLLLFLLLLDAAFSFFITKFAQYCELELPCLLCSRLDHVLGKEEPDFYKNLLCNDHKSEISSLVLCHDHHKIADIHGMCEECVLSFAKMETNDETYKLMIGKLGPNCLQKPFLSLDSIPYSCSCCSKLWKTRPLVQKLVQSRLSTSISKPDIPLPKSPRYRCLNRQEGLKKRKERFTMSSTPFVRGNVDYDAFSHMGYTEVKITSDSDSDLPLSDDEDIIAAPRDPRSCYGENLIHQSSELLPKRQNEYFSPALHTHKPKKTTSILLHSDLEPEKGETTTPTFFAANGNVRHCLTEVNWQKIHNETSPELPEFTSLVEIPLSSSVPEISAVISTNEVDRSSLSKKLNGSGLPDFFSPKTASMLSNVTHRNPSPSVSVQFPVNQSKENWFHTKGKSNIEHASTTNNWESIDLNGTTVVTEVKTNPTRKMSAVIMRSCSDSYPRDVSSSTIKEVNVSSFLSEDERRDFPLDKNPVVNGPADKPQMLECRILSKFPSIERSPLHEPQEENAGDIEGENIIDRLRQENEHDKKHINDLYKELEEERSAAAIAANQAMAMITKLQEEKATLHMEALQYLRMMEEQAEYDVDELEKANDLLAEKEKEIQDLQAELDFFRIKYPEDFPEYSVNIGLDLEDVQSSYMETAEFEKS